MSTGRNGRITAVTILVKSTDATPAKVSTFKQAFPKFSIRETSYSLEELEQLRDTLYAIQDDPSQKIASVYIDEKQNAVVAEVVGLTQKDASLLQTNTLNSSALKLVSVANYDIPTFTVIWAGSEVRSATGSRGSVCTAAQRNNAGGFLTYAHHRSVNDAVYAADGTTLVGTVTALAVSSGQDAAFVTLAADTTASNYIPSADVFITAYGSVSVGDAVTMYCKNGIRTGTVIAPRVRYNLSGIVDSNGTLIDFYGIKVSYASEQGDSGGCAVLTANRQTLVGMQSSYNASTNTSKLAIAPDFISTLGVSLFQHFGRIQPAK